MVGVIALTAMETVVEEDVPAEFVAVMVYVVAD